MKLKLGEKMEKLFLAMCLSVFWISAWAQNNDNSQALIGSWNGTSFIGISTGTLSAAGGKLDKALILPEMVQLRLTVTQAMKGVCTANYTWKDLSGKKIGYDFGRGVDADAFHFLCVYDENTVTFAGRGVTMSCKFKDGGNKMSCVVFNFTKNNNFTAIGKPEFTKVKK